MARVKTGPKMRPRWSLFWLGLSLMGLGYAIYAGPDIRKAYQDYTDITKQTKVTEQSFLIAARDIEYCYYHLACGAGMRTDTIFYMKLRGSEATLVAIPRDLRYTSHFCTNAQRKEGLSSDDCPLYIGKINAVYQNRGGSEGLRRAVEDVLGVPVQHYAIVTLESVRDLIDAVDGVDVNLPFAMKYTDTAAKLFIDFPAGKNHFNGEDAVKYMRFRHAEGSDLGRLDRIKELMNQVLGKLQRPQYWGKLPKVANSSWKSVRTNLELTTALALANNVRGLTIKGAILPTLEDGNDLILDQEEMKSFSASLLGFEADAKPLERLHQAAKDDFKILISDGSGTGAGKRYASAIQRLGLPKPEVVTNQDDSPSAVQVKSGLSVTSQQNPTFMVARDYADITHLPLLSRFRLEYDGYDVIVHLGKDAVM